MRHIPLKYQADCHFCGETVDTRRSAGNYELKSGWVQSRTQGGANALTLPLSLRQYAHEMCIEQEKHVNGSVQFTLWG